MADERKYFVICADNCKFESMTKEQILTAIAQAISTGEIKDVDTGFVTSIKEQNSGKAAKIWIGTQAEYIAQKESIPENTFCIITDDTTAEDIEAEIAEVKKSINKIIETRADYVIEQGTSNGWTYRKWASGIAECWGEFTYKGVQITTPIDGTVMNRSDLLTQALPENLFKTTSDSHITMKRIHSVSVAYLSRIATLTTSEVTFYAMRFGDVSENAAFDFHFNIKGTWK